MNSYQIEVHEVAKHRRHEVAKDSKDFKIYELPPDEPTTIEDEALELAIYYFSAIGCHLLVVDWPLNNPYKAMSGVTITNFQNEVQ